mmetsp:Transcript_11458/g.15449  ORF Transcript_11458/g.15449 Transcript_11458/m.15449 type:complete len:100 (+) Transcript_11458:640-939(+)|eukprot:CAMPEP_0170454386 /NCGR_PEP_ID=MMETSP0123-20130129/2655_1 /TAXON_ID=182087 /ORGANISM="Favella ehrenbergii, Strain Fehren 1" /LENGTH=99 /DNA_ID=CAMNT_0010717081 /DNA_START=550 /DNA_END=849 /DNA_ORIENTATION=-
MGSDALYVNFSSQVLYKLDVLKSLHANDFDILETSDRSLNEFYMFKLENGRNAELKQVLELENESDAWRQHGQPPDLVCCVYDNGSVEVFDRSNGDLLK